MIFMQSRKTRRFIGRLNTGQEIITSLRAVCTEQQIRCGEMRATGFLTDVVLEVFDHGQRRYRPVVLGSVPYQLTSFLGNVSILDGRTTVHIHVTLLPDLASGDTTLVGGRLKEGRVVALEFTVDSFDDFTLVRRLDPETGFEQWVELDFAEARTGGDDGGDDDGFEGDELDAEEEEEEEIEELNPGDVLDHPRLKRCEVVSCDGERAVIKLESGRSAELHLSVIQLELKEELDDGKRVYGVSVRRR